MKIDPEAPLCSSGKRPFRDQKTALKSLNGARWVRRNSGVSRLPGCVEEGAYECHVCHWWHLRSSNKPRRRGELANRGRRRR